jgi:flagella basal body P-ring formation protein FlgA
MIWLVTALAAPPAGAWDLALPDTVQVNGATARLTDLAGGPVPPAAADMVVHAGGRPGTSVTISRQTLLRHLVARGLAGGVRFRGAEDCVLVFAGGQVAGGELAEAVRAVLQALVPASHPGAPDSWFELELPDSELAADEGWTVRCLRTEPLAPGRNPVRCELADAGRRTAFSVTAILHRYGEVAEARVAVGRNQTLLAEHFRWDWRDLAGVRGRPVVGREALGGTSAARSLAPGDMLLLQDLKATPVVRRGDPVELWLMRGGLAVRVTATARQEGCVGQVIPVRNSLSGQLVNARVAAPGVVEWRN